MAIIFFRSINKTLLNFERQYFFFLGKIMEFFGYIYCNLKNCNKCLESGYAWVTACSHIFCNEDGEKIFQNTLTCPICLKELDSKTELVRMQLKPTEQYRNMILCGLRPELIMDISTKGLSFWFSQLKQQNDFMRHIIEKEREKRLNLENSESDTHFLVKKLQNKLDESKKENDYLKRIILEKFSSSQKPAALNMNIDSNNNNNNNNKLSPETLTRMVNLCDGSNLNTNHQNRNLF